MNRCLPDVWLVKLEGGGGSGERKGRVKSAF